jgi:small redox-active disulfide protein 2
MKIEVLGTGCAKCANLMNVVKQAIAKSSKFVQLEKVEDVVRIMEYQVLSTPALVIDGKVVSSGKVLSLDEVLAFLNTK